ncbi:MAG: metal-dependent hydrolase [Arenicella sp.]|jgi:predicted metal-dependent hydrolase|nr:metal-dependent hydrolase [Arenicella sp.]
MTAVRAISKTPEGVSVKPRNLDFNLEQALACDWLHNDPFMTAVFNAMSISFPSGEKNFIDSVRAYEDRITDKKLLEEIKGFYQQESIHSREHRKYNKILCEQRGYDLSKLESVYLNRLKKTKENPHATPRVMLASTVSAEHFTASFGENVLNNKLFKNVDETIATLWQWHCMEELEHKSIAMDVYQQIGGSYKMRSRVMRITMWMFFKDTLKVAFKMLRHDKQLWKWKTLKSISKFLFAKDGFIRLHIPAYRIFFSRDFHPWDVDSRALLQAWQQRLEPTLAST